MLNVHFVNESVAVRKRNVSNVSFGDFLSVRRHTLPSPSDGVLCLMKLVRATFLSDTAHCPMVTSKSVCRMTVPDSG